MRVLPSVGFLTFREDVGVLRVRILFLWWGDTDHSKPPHPFRMRMRHLLLTSALVIAGATQAQTFNSSSGVDHCGFERHHRQLMQASPDYAARVSAFNQLARTWEDDGLRGGGSFKVPVVVHVMDAGTSIDRKSVV